MNVKKIGNEYETKFAEYIQGKGFWCTILPYGKNGQPCDIIAVKNNRTTFVDVKHCCEDRFSFSKIQPNQLTCFEYNLRCGNTCSGFAIWFEKTQDWRWLNYATVRNSTKKSVRYDELSVI